MLLMLLPFLSRYGCHKIGVHKSEITFHEIKIDTRSLVSLRKMDCILAHLSPKATQ